MVVGERQKREGKGEGPENGKRNFVVSWKRVSHDDLGGDAH